MPYPGTELNRLMRESGLFDENLPWSAYGGSFRGRPVVRTRAISAERLVRLQGRMLREFFLRPKYILRRLARIRSPQDAAYWFGAGIEFIMYLFRRKKSNS